MTYRGIVFDLDGTLINSIQDICNSMNKVLQSHDFPVFDIEAYKMVIGNGIEQLVHDTIPPERRTKKIIEELTGEMKVIYDLHYMENTTVYFGIPELLDNLCSLKIKTAILSNKPHDYTLKICNELFGNWTFDYILGLSDQFPRKPNPLSSLYILNYLNLNPNEVLFVGDSGIDIQTALNSGMLPLGVTWGYKAKMEMTKAGAKDIIEKPSDILKYFLMK